MVTFALSSLPGLHAQTAWITISALINIKKPLAWKRQPISLFHAIHQDRISNEVNTIAERVHLIYWALKEEIANQKIASLQTLVDCTGRNDRLRDLRLTSSVTVTEFILLISEHSNDRIVSEVKQSPCWASMVDETTGIATFQQYITFVQYINTKRCQATAFLDARGATAANLFRLWNDVAADYDLDVSKHVAVACDGAAAMICRRNSLFQKLLNKTQSLTRCAAMRTA